MAHTEHFIHFFTEDGQLLGDGHYTIVVGDLSAAEAHASRVIFEGDESFPGAFAAEIFDQDDAVVGGIVRDLMRGVRPCGA